VSPEDYWRRIARIPLYRDRDSASGDEVLCRQQNGAPVLVTKPEYLKPEEREDVVAIYEMLYRNK
jgi:hypothetical protein